MPSKLFSSLNQTHHATLWGEFSMENKLDENFINANNKSIKYKSNSNFYECKHNKVAAN